MPRVLTEDETLEKCQQSSIARFGDGELRLAVGGSAVSQRADPHLAAELVHILGKSNGLLVGIPNFDKTPRRADWAKYNAGGYRRLYRQDTYGSAFITRPDNAPWIDRPDYWQKVRDLWRDRDVVLVTGDAKSLTAATLSEARSVVTVEGPRQHAYDVIDAIERKIVEVGKDRRILMCLGAAATVLAARLNRRGFHALDLGHIGMFMKHAGAYRFTQTDLASQLYRDQLRTKHSLMKWGSSGASWAPEVLSFARELGAKSVLDYGCGRGALKPAIASELKVFEYDPGIAGKDQLPKPADIVVCTDVLEHIEPEKIDAVLNHIRLLAKVGAYLVISMRPAREHLPDGRNAHLIIENAVWWTKKLQAGGWASIKTEERKGLCVWLRK